MLWLDNIQTIYQSLLRSPVYSCLLLTGDYHTDEVCHKYLRQPTCVSDLCVTNCPSVLSTSVSVSPYCLLHFTFPPLLQALSHLLFYLLCPAVHVPLLWKLVNMLHQLVLLAYFSTLSFLSYLCYFPFLSLSFCLLFPSL